MARHGANWASLCHALLCVVVAVTTLATTSAGDVHDATASPASTQDPVAQFLQTLGILSSIPSNPHPALQKLEQCLSWTTTLTHPQYKVRGAVVDYEGCYVTSLLGELAPPDSVVPRQQWILREPNVSAITPSNPFAGFGLPLPGTDPAGVTPFHRSKPIPDDLPPWLQLPFINFSSALASSADTTTSSSTSSGSSSGGVDLAPSSMPLGGDEFVSFQHQCAAACAMRDFTSRLTYFVVRQGRCECIASRKAFEDVRRSTASACCAMAYPDGSVSTTRQLLKGPNAFAAARALECSPFNSFVPVFSLNLMCPVNVSICGSVDFCETKSGCCIPKGSSDDVMPLFQVTMIHWMVTFFIVLLVCQLVWWVLRFRMRRYERMDQAEGGELLLAPGLGGPGGNGGNGTAFADTDFRRSKAEAEIAATEAIKLFESIPPKSRERGDLITDDDDGSCPMCLEDFIAQRCIVTACGHRIHYACMLEFLSFALRSVTKAPTCPNCRQDVLVQRELAVEEVERAAAQIEARETQRQREEAAEEAAEQFSAELFGREAAPPGRSSSASVTIDPALAAAIIMGESDGVAAADGAQRLRIQEAVARAQAADAERRKRRKSIARRRRAALREAELLASEGPTPDRPRPTVIYLDSAIGHVAIEMAASPDHHRSPVGCRANSQDGGSPGAASPASGGGGGGTPFFLGAGFDSPPPAQRRDAASRQLQFGDDFEYLQGANERHGGSGGGSGEREVEMRSIASGGGSFVNAPPDATGLWGAHAMGGSSSLSPPSPRFVPPVPSSPPPPATLRIGSGISSNSANGSGSGSPSPARRPAASAVPAEIDSIMASL